ncbi:MAG TPA: alkaline phosphatase family protein [Thermoanaerobaculia bacterium]
MSAQRSRSLRVPVWGLGLALLAAGPSLRAQTVPPHNHVVIVAFENHSYEAANNGVVGLSSAPYMNNTLIPSYGLADQFYPNAHGSMSEYFYMLEGTPYCTTSGTVHCGGNPTTLVADADSLIREVISAGKTWKQYTDSLPSRGFIVEEPDWITGSNPTGHYYSRHAPAVFLSDVRQGTPPDQAVDCTGEPDGYDAVKQACNVVNFEDAANGFQADLDAGRLPNFSLVIPNGCNDAHDCGVSSADAWLQANIDPLLRSSYFQPGGDGLLIIWWDEGSLSGYTGSCGGAEDDRSSSTSCTGGGGRAALIVAAPDVAPGFHSQTHYQQPSVTRTIANALGVGVPPAAASATPMGDFFTAPVSNIAPWQEADIGAVDLAGHASLGSGVYTVTAGGTDIWDTADAFHYVYRPLSGDGTIVADISGLSLPPGAAFSLAGVMIREKLTANSIHATMMITTQGKAKFRRRTTEGGITDSDGPSTGSTYPPRWLKLTRVGNDFSAYISSDGAAWTQVFTTQTIPMAANVYIGFLALRNGAGTPATTASFQSVSLLPPSWQGADIGAVDLPGTVSSSGGTYTVDAGGTDIWDTADAFYYVYQPLAGDGTIVADVSNLTLPPGAAFSLAGVMIREKLTANAVHATMMITTQGKAKFRRRATEGGITDSDGPSTGSTYPPRWLKLTRAANDFSAYISSDGATWTQVFSTQTIPMATNAYIGFLVLRNGAGTAEARGTVSGVAVTP